MKEHLLKTVPQGTKTRLDCVVSFSFVWEATGTRNGAPTPYPNSHRSAFSGSNPNSVPSRTRTLVASAALRLLCTLPLSYSLQDGARTRIAPPYQKRMEQTEGKQGGQMAGCDTNTLESAIEFVCFRQLLLVLAAQTMVAFSHILTQGMERYPRVWSEGSWGQIKY
eukprot:6173350-Amphidinium_carterae.2